MKLAVSIPDPIAAAADKAAARAGISRSQYYANALAQMLHRQSEAALGEKINEVCDTLAAGEDAFDPALMQASVNAIYQPVSRAKKR